MKELAIDRQNELNETGIALRELIAEKIEENGIGEPVLASEIKPTDKLKNDLFLDSLDFVELVMKIEEKFDIAITSEEAELLVNGTVDELIETVVKKKHEGSCPDGCCGIY